MWETFVLYSRIYNWGIFLLFLFTFIKWKMRPGDSIIHSTDRSYFWPLILTIAYTVWMGMRPLDVSGWNDTNNYKIEYFFLEANPEEALAKISLSREWLWGLIEYVFVTNHIRPEYWFLLIEACYMGFSFLALKRLFRNNLSIAFLFFISSFSFYSYSYNTIRNGMACAILLYAFSFILIHKRKDIIKGIIICLLAIGVHKSTFLPSICLLVASYSKMNMTRAMIWWSLSILISLVAGSQIQSLFMSIGFDDRMKSYLNPDTMNAYGNMFRHTGFRWDFLLYSLMPIVLGYYVSFIKRIVNRNYSILLNTYILANSFWIMVITAANTDRFAYLSWFLFPVLIAFPLLKMHVWSDQNSKAMNILLYYVGFTLFMNLYYYG